MIQQTEKYLVNVVDAKRKSADFLGLRANQFYFCKASTHQNFISNMPSTMRTPACIFWINNLAFKLETLILWIMALHYLKMGFVPHQRHGKHWRTTGLSCVIVASALVQRVPTKRPKYTVLRFANVRD